MFGKRVSEIFSILVLQIQVLDAGRVDYRDCLERRELVERLKETQDYIPLSAQQLLQRFLLGLDEDTLSSASPLQETSPAEGM